MPGICIKFICIPILSILINLLQKLFQFHTFFFLDDCQFMQILAELPLISLDFQKTSLGVACRYTKKKKKSVKKTLLGWQLTLPLSFHKSFPKKNFISHLIGTNTFGGTDYTCLLQSKRFTGSLCFSRLRSHPSSPELPEGVLSFIISL